MYFCCFFLFLKGGGSVGYGYSGMPGGGMQIVNNMAQFVAPRSYPHHNKLASNSNTQRGLSGPPDLEFGTDLPVGDRMMNVMNGDKFIINDIMDDHEHNMEDSLSITDADLRGAGIWGVPTINTFSGNSKSHENRKKRAGKIKHRRGGGADPKDQSLTSIATTVNTMNTVDIIGINSAIKPINDGINSHKSTETSVDESSDANKQHEDGRPINEEKIDSNTIVIRRDNSILKEKKEKKQEIGPEENGNVGNNNNNDSDDTDEEVTVSDDPISEIMKSLKRMQSVKHHSI